VIPDPSEVDASTLVLTSTSVQPGRVVAQWGAAANAESYLVAIGPSSNPPAGGCVGGVATKQPSFTFDGIATNQNSTVRVCAVRETAANPKTNGVTRNVLVLPAPPAQPQSIVVTSVNTTTARLSWQSGGAGTAMFRLAYRSDRPPTSCADGTVTLTTAFTSLDVGGLEYSTFQGPNTYHFLLCSISAAPASVVSVGVPGTMRPMIPDNVVKSCDPSGSMRWNSYGSKHDVKLTITNPSDANLVYLQVLGNPFGYPRDVSQSVGYCNSYTPPTNQNPGFCVGGYPPRQVPFTVAIYSTDVNGQRTPTTTFSVRSPYVLNGAIIPGSCTVAP
jgi:hypothetical protein